MRRAIEEYSVFVLPDRWVPLPEPFRRDEELPFSYFVKDSCSNPAFVISQRKIPLSSNLITIFSP